MSDGSMPSSVDVEQWLTGVRAELERIAAVIEPLLAEQAKLREREALLMKLLRSLEDDAVSNGTPADGAASVATPTHPAKDGSVLDYVRSGVLEVLREHDGGPMHINDIHAKFVGKGYRVPGAGRPANLTAHLARAEGIVSPSRGHYAIAREDTVDDDVASASSRRKR